MSMRISDDDNLLDIKDYTLTLKFKLQNWGKLADPDELARMLQHVLRDWNEGRYPFDAEMIVAGLSRCLRRAVYHTVEKEAQDEFGHEIVTTHEGYGNTAKWYLEAEKRFAETKKPWTNSEPKVEIT
jgi:hypothetical protein